MTIEIPVDNSEAEAVLPSVQPDGSGIGVNYADAFIKNLRVSREGIPQVNVRRHGLKIVVSVGDRKGEGLMRRLRYGPDVKRILREALKEAALSAGVELSFQVDKIVLRPSDA